MINIAGLNFSYKPNSKVLNNISFSVGEGEIFGFLGPNGAGKSTTQKIITGIQKNYSGSVKLLNYEMQSAGRDIYQQIGVLFEYPYLYASLSGYDNLKYFATFYDCDAQKIPNLLERLGFKMDFLDKPVASYSKGMRQRISMARALMMNPRVLFLDEPTSGLDPAGAVNFREIIREQKDNGVTIFLTTHNMYDAELLCDKVAFIVDGEIVVIGQPSELKNNNAKKTIEIKYISKGEMQTEFVGIDDVSQLIDNNRQIVSVNTLEPSFEDVFIQYTGRALR